MNFTELYESVIWAVVITIYIAIGYYATRYIKNKLFKSNYILNTFIVSFLYALFFGITLISSGYGDPGFAFPGTIIFAIIFNVLMWVPVNIFTQTVVIPFLFWWLTISVFIFLIIKVAEKNRRME